MFMIRITALIQCLLLLCLPLDVIQADKDELRKRLDSRHPLGDTLTIEEAVESFEKTFNIEVFIPKYIPFEVTHSGGYFSEKQKMVVASYYNDVTQKKMKIYAFYNTSKWEISGEIIELKDGTKAIYHKNDDSVVDSIFMELNGIRYIIGIGKPVELETLIKVASSL